MAEWSEWDVLWPVPGQRHRRGRQTKEAQQYQSGREPKASKEGHHALVFSWERAKEAGRAESFFVALLALATMSRAKITADP